MKQNVEKIFETYFLNNYSKAKTLIISNLLQRVYYFLIPLHDNKKMF